MDLKKCDEKFFSVYSEDVDENKYLYEYKTGEFKAGEVIGMKTIPYTCKGTTYNHNKDNGEAWAEYTQLGEFIGEEWYRETDLQYPICNNC